MMTNDRFHSDPVILGGELCFKGSRLSVGFIGRCVLAGETTENLMQDYPYLSLADVELAKKYALHLRNKKQRAETRKHRKRLSTISVEEVDKAVFKLFCEHCNASQKDTFHDLLEVMITAIEKATTEEEGSQGKEGTPTTPRSSHCTINNVY